MKKQTNIRLSKHAINLLEELANMLSTSKTAIIELAIREYARDKLKK